tara:strand:- start:126 stop:668 length:543 start_codon:yes stop_codon:yes gene_type:complete
MKKILYSILLILLLVIGYFTYSIFNPVSPLKISKYNYDEKDVASITYSSPSKKDRLIFGSKDEGALVPYDEYWRTGANRHTFIENNISLFFNDNELKAGKYSIYTIPSKDSWEIYFNEEVNFLGINRPSFESDIFSVNVLTNVLFNSVEDFRIEFSSDSLSNYIDFSWDKTKVSVPFMLK